MIEFFHNIVLPAMLPFTIPFLMMLAYWLFVICTGLDFGSEALDGALDGLVDGVLDGAVDGVVDAAADGAIDAATDGAVGGAAEAAGESLLGMLLNFLNLGKVPATIVLSLIILKMWIFAYIYHILLKPNLGGLAIPLLAITIMVSFVIIVASVFLTAYTTRPLRKLFVDKIIHGTHSLVGNICIIKTSRVSAKSGQAEMKVDDNPLIFMVRCTQENQLSKGSEAVIVGYDSQKSIYEVRPLT